MAKLFVFPATNDSWFIFPTLSEYSISAGDAVLMGIPKESTGHQADLVVDTVDKILSLMDSKGTPLRFIRVHLSESDIPDAVISLLTPMYETRWDEVIVTLCDSISCVSMSMYLASVIYASWAEGRTSPRIVVLVPSRASQKQVAVPLPTIRMPRDPRLLEELQKSPRARLVDLQAKLKRHTSTVSRQINAAIDGGYVVDESGSYRLTQLGNILVTLWRFRNSVSRSGA